MLQKPQSIATTRQTNSKELRIPGIQILVRLTLTLWCRHQWQVYTRSGFHGMERTCTKRHGMLQLLTQPGSQLVLYGWAIQILVMYARSSKEKVYCVTVVTDLLLSLFFCVWMIFKGLGIRGQAVTEMEIHVLKY